MGGSQPHDGDVTMHFYCFENYTLRPATFADRDHLAAWLHADPDHAGRVPVEFFYGPEPGAECYVLEDAQGEPVFFFKMTRALRLDIQFPPILLPEDRARVREAMQATHRWLLPQAQAAGIRQLIFRSAVRPLINFCKKRLGFHESPQELVCHIPPAAACEAQQKAENREP